MNDAATKWHAQRATRPPDADDYERKGLAQMDDQEAEQSYHRWRAWTKRMNEARKR